MEEIIAAGDGEFHDGSKSGSSNVSKPVSKDVSKNVIDLITEKYGDLLTKRQKAIISMIHDNPFVSAKEIAESLSVTSRTIYTELSYMQNSKIIRREGSRKTGVWIILE